MTTDPRGARPRERIPAGLRSGATASDRARTPSPGPVSGAAPVRSGRPSAASPGARRTTHAADASRRFVASVSVIATLVMVGAMARSAAAQSAADAAANANAAAANANATAAGSAGVAAPVAPATFPAPTAITLPPTAGQGPATTTPQRVAPAPTAPAPRATVAPPVSKSRAS